MSKFFGKKMLFLLAIVSFFAGAIILAGCSESGTPNTEKVQLSFEENAYQLELGDELELVPVVKNGNLEELNLGWNSYNIDVVTVENGVLTAVGVGQTSVKVYLVDDATVSAIVSITVVSGNNSSILAFGDVPTAMVVEDTFQIEYKVIDTENEYEVSYETSDANVLTVSEAGLITAVANGSAIITVSAKNITTGAFAHYKFAIKVSNAYSISYELNDEGDATNNESNPVKYTENDGRVDLYEPTRPGYGFIGWYDNAELEGNPISFINGSKAQDITLYAKWEEMMIVEATEFAADKPYKLGFYQGNNSKQLWFTGYYEKTYYGATSEAYAEGCYVYVITVEGGYQLKLDVAGATKYLELVQSGTHINISIVDAPTIVWAYNAEYNTFTINFDGTDYFMGTHSNYNTLSASKLSDAATKFVSHLYEEVKPNDELVAKEILDSIDIETRFTEDYEFPKYENVTWSLKMLSGTARIVESNGSYILSVTRPTTEDYVTTLTATCKVNDYVETREFTITVVKAVAANEIELTTDTLNMPFNRYSDGEAFIKDTFINWYQVANYDDHSNAIQMRHKDDKGDSAIYNTTKLSSGITQIIFNYASDETVYDGNELRIKFGNDQQVSQYSTILTTVKDTYTYTIIPDATTYTYFAIEIVDQTPDNNYTQYWEQIVISVSKDINDGDIVNAIYNNLEVDKTEIDASISMSLLEHENIVWSLKEESDYASIYNNVVSFIQPSYSDGDKTVTLVATVQRGEYIKVKEFEVTLIKNPYKLLASFEFGADSTTIFDESKDGDSIETSKSFTDGDYTLSLVNCDKVYYGSFDGLGNSCLKLGTRDIAAKLTINVPHDVDFIYIYIAGYKANNAKISINGGTTQTITTKSADGEYTVLKLDTKTTKTITLATLSGGYRAKIDTVEFYDDTNYTCEHNWVDATYETPKTCSKCGLTEGEPLVCTHNWVDATYTDPKTCTICGATEGEPLECTEHVDINLDSLCDNCGAQLAEIYSAKITFSEQGYTNAQVISSVTVNEIVSLLLDKGTNSNTPKYYDSGTAVRLYGGGTLTISAEGYKLAKVIITANSTGKVHADSTVSVGTLTNNETSATITDINSNSVTFTQGGTTGNVRLVTIEIFYYEVECTEHVDENSDGKCDVCDETMTVAPTIVTFDFGANGSAVHNDGKDLSAGQKYTSGAYSLTFTTLSKVYGSAYDAKGNSCIKLGTSKLVGSFSFTVADDVQKVVIYVAQYKTNTTKINVNGTSYTINTASNNGEYTAIEIDTSSVKTVTFTTVSSNYRCMINTIEYYI